MDLEKLSLNAAGLDTRLSGKIRLDPEVFEFSGIKGEFAGGLLSGGLKVRDYAKAPDAELEVNLTKLDLAKLLAVNAATLPEGAGEKTAAAPKSPAPAPAAKAPASAAPPMKARGSVKIASLEHPGAQAANAALSWDLKGITPDLAKLSGWAKLRVGEGRFSGLGAMSEQSRLLKVVLLPFTVLGKITSLGGIKLLPDLSAVTFSEIVGDYAFQNGVMTLKESRLESPAARGRRRDRGSSPGNPGPGHPRHGGQGRAAHHRGRRHFRRAQAPPAAGQAPDATRGENPAGPPANHQSRRPSQRAV